MVFSCWLPVQAQTNKKIRNLQARRTELQNQIVQSEKILLTMNKDVKSQLSDLAVITNQVAQQELLLKTIEADVLALEKEIGVVEQQLDTLEVDMSDKKGKFKIAMQQAYLNNRGVKDKLMFVLTAQTVSQMYRRARYIKEYSVHLKAQAEQIEARQKQIQQKRSDLLAAKGEKSNLLRQKEQEKAKLENKQGAQKKLVTDLQKKQRNVQQEINKKKKQSESLNAQIDKLIEQEIAAAKKREEARKKEQARLEAERKKKEVAEAAKREAERKEKGQSLATNTTSRSSATIPKTEKMDSYDVSRSELKVAASFERNKGSLPMPITGAYTIVSHYGANNVSGLKNVSIDNKGIDIKGQAGANARAIFEGEVSAVFSYSGVKGVLLRHGKYISVYVNLSSVSVKQGQKVNARDVIGKVANNREDGYVLHFQLRKETTKLNPESWLKK
ncbi:MAG: peptidoglycan DD-metalloendopeptidase family protein [Bacteroidaceae bacterium]|nr:peptidoglycan DD-metalloendopeptidase family protein [Bacteroidaceae bacterium]